MFEFVDRGDAVVVGLRISQPEWSASEDVFKLFTFRRGTDVVIAMQDCTGRDDALSTTPRLGNVGSTEP